MRGIAPPVSARAPRVIGSARGRRHLARNPPRAHYGGVPRDFDPNPFEKAQIECRVADDITSRAYPAPRASEPSTRDPRQPPNTAIQGRRQLFHAADCSWIASRFEIRKPLFLDLLGDSAAKYCASCMAEPPHGNFGELPIGKAPGQCKTLSGRQISAPSGSSLS